MKVGLDPSFNLLERTRERGSEAVLAKGEWLPFKDGAFDVRYRFSMYLIILINSIGSYFAHGNPSLRRSGARARRDSSRGRRSFWAHTSQTKVDTTLIFSKMGVNSYLVPTWRKRKALWPPLSACSMLLSSLRISTTTSTFYNAVKTNKTQNTSFFIISLFFDWCGGDLLGEHKVVIFRVGRLRARLVTRVLHVLRVEVYCARVN